jgi:tripeptide aminopeptidase
MHEIHSQREWVSLQDMARAADVLIRLAQLWEERSGA